MTYLWHTPALDLDLTDAPLQADLAELRARFPETRTLYREVCGLLFFRYGVTPTDNKLYSQVHGQARRGAAGVLAGAAGTHARHHRPSRLAGDAEGHRGRGRGRPSGRRPTRQPPPSWPRRAPNHRVGSGDAGRGAPGSRGDAGAAGAGAGGTGRRRQGAGNCVRNSRPSLSVPASR
ncbi:conserved hypothetical protein (plasmid) [Cupriavidus necator H16]|uniref:Uncharacterized protein n=1 Tax=Cupriavidus necator (strain ATCC 17699 / DSM 428 / KCTC 22496 / NCIMB 10442 / H16 / Stanier 337) TaxID=381666 RepID=Q7WXL6_CUPNH|nr:conserved hypothetical protein [Cupriavidus necator H16]